MLDAILLFSFFPLFFSSFFWLEESVDESSEYGSMSGTAPDHATGGWCSLDEFLYQSKYPPHHLKNYRLSNEPLAESNQSSTRRGTLRAIFNP